MKKARSPHGSNFVLYCFSDDGARSESNTLSQFTCECGSIELDGSWEVGIKDAFFNAANLSEDDDDYTATTSSNGSDELMREGTQQNNIDSITLPESLNNQVISLDFLCEILVKHSKNFQIYADREYFSKYNPPSMDYAKFPQYGFREGVYADDYTATPKDSDKSTKCILQVADYLTSDQKEHLKNTAAEANKDLDGRQVEIRIPLGRSITLKQVLQMTIRYITARHASYKYTNESAERQFRDLKRTMTLSGLGVNEIIHNNLSKFSGLILSFVNAEKDLLEKNRRETLRHTVEQPRTLNIKSNQQLAFVYCDIIVAEVVSSKRSKLLALLPLTEESEYKRISNVSFAKLEKFSFSSISFEIRSYLGNFVNFHSSIHPNIIVLQFRRSQPHVN